MTAAISVIVYWLDTFSDLFYTMGRNGLGSEGAHYIEHAWLGGIVEI